MKTTAMKESIDEAKRSFFRTLQGFGVRFVKGEVVHWPEKISTTAREKIAGALRTLSSARDLSPRGVQLILEDLQAMTSYDVVSVAGQVQKKITPGVGSATARLVIRVRNIYPEFGELRSEFAKRTRLLKDVGDVVSLTKKGPKALRQGVTKLTNIFKEDQDAYVETIRWLEQATGKQILGRLAGTEFQKVTPGVLRTSIALGGAFGLSTALANPWFALLIPIFSPRAVGGAVTSGAQAVGMAKTLGEKALPAVGPAARVGLQALFGRERE